MRGPKRYRSLEEFEREEIKPHIKYGWSLEDLYQDADINRREDRDDGEPRELNFDE
ncbi:MAG: hypothetical protein ACFCGT_19045 [Sandaracinaceae bacterium]